MKKTLSLLLLSISFFSNAQTFQNCYSVNSTGWGFSIDQTYDGGSIIAGFTIEPINNYQIAIIKINSLGDTTWVRRTGGPYYDYAYCILQSSDSNYVVSGYTTDASLGHIYFSKIDRNGDLLWQKKYSGSSNSNRTSFIERGNNFYIATSNAQLNLLKTDTDGNLIWAKKYLAVPPADATISLKNTSDGLLIGTLTTIGFSATFTALKLDTAGNVVWCKRYYMQNEYFYDMESTLDDGFILAGSSSSFSINNTGCLVRCDASGNILWSRKYEPNTDHFGDLNRSFYSVTNSHDEGFIITGGQRDHPPLDGFILKTNSLGQAQWSRSYGGINDDESFFDAQETTDGKIIAVGNSLTFDGIYVVKTDFSGQNNCNEYDHFLTDSLVTMNVDSLNIAPQNLSLTQNDLLYTWDKGGSVFPLCAVSVVELKSDDEFSFFPNPSSIGIISFHSTNKVNCITITDLSGRCIRTWRPVADNESIVLSAGMYVATIQAGQKYFSKKLVVTPLK